MNTNNIFINQKTKVFFYLKDKSICSNCYNEFDDSSIVVICCKYYLKRKGVVKGYCKDCLKKIKHDADIENWITATIVSYIPKDCTYYIEQPPTLNYSNLGNKDAWQIDSEVTIDRTRHAKHTPSIEGATIGKAIEEVKNPTTEKEAKQLIKGLGKPLIEQKEKRLIE